ncbi:MAG TPA: hypothetical protein VMF06_08725 [Candidatus Limnocylindria bacterium]|jgi:predicted  nucleic acid-binding Zn-ribbon protein|nr:hypothetical protein [Candidatus Limnocylindria bacterium]
MKNVTADLLALQNSGSKSGANGGPVESSIEKLRGKVPEAILAQFDRLQLRGKKGVAVVRNGVCGECHITIPLGTLRRAALGTELQRCGNCGRYLHLPEDVIIEPVAPVAARKPVRKRKEKAAIAS